LRWLKAAGYAVTENAKDQSKKTFRGQHKP
jgi:hypothetical protein